MAGAGGGELTAVRYRAGRELSGRRRSTLALIVLIGLLAGIALAGALGARRNATAFSRLEGWSHPFDVLVNPDEGAQSKLDAGLVARLPGVEQAGRGDGFFAAATGSDPDSDLSTLYFAPADDVLGGRLDRPKLVTGRMPSPGAADEALVNTDYAQRHDVGPGDVLHLTLYDLSMDTPKTTVLPPIRVTGVGVPPESIEEDESNAAGVVVLTPAFDRLYSAQRGFYGIYVRLRDGASAIPAFRQAVQRVAGGEVIEYQTWPDVRARTQRGIRPETLALTLFAILASIVGVVIAGQALGRHITADADEELALTATGFTPRQRFQARMACAAVIAAAGLALAVVVAVVGSPLFPIGLARRAEPHPGLSAPIGWLLVGWAAGVVLVLGVSAWPAWRASRRSVSRERRRVRRSTLTDAVARAGAPPTVVAGVRMALVPGEGRAAVPVRSTILGSVLAMALAVGAIVFGASLDRLLDHPASFGWNWSNLVGLTMSDDNGDPITDLQHYATTVADRPGVEAAAVLQEASVQVHGQALAALGLRPVTGDLSPTVLQGRPPLGSDELALGARTMQTLGLHLADTVDVSGRTGHARRRVVGVVVFPAIAKYTGADNVDLGVGALVNQAALDRIGPEPGQQQLLVRLSPDTDLHRTLTSGFETDVQQGNLSVVSRPQRPGEIMNLERVRQVPRWLAVVFIVTTVAALVNLVAVAVGRRRRDLALFKCLGFRRAQLSRAVAWQATTLTVITAAIAVPVGVVAGRVAWSWLARSIGAAPSPTVPLGPIALVVAATLAVANVVALVPAWSAGRTQAAALLRAD
jgi:ABC-type lipoprotein release transport system permease subunit